MSETLIGNVRGLQGVQGPEGPQGVQGPAGATGATGPQGPAGPAGETGATGPQGPAGPAGPTGPQGPAGADGSDGSDGSDGVGVYSVEVTADGPTTGGEQYSVLWTDTNYQTHSAGSFVAPEGPQGAAGATGSQGPAGADGVTPSIRATASVDSTTGTPAVTVTKTGTDAAPSFAFAFSGLKGADGEAGSVAYTVKNYTFNYDTNKTDEENGFDFLSLLSTVQSEAVLTGPTAGRITISGGTIKMNAYCRTATASSSNSYTRTGYVGFYGITNHASIATIRSCSFVDYTYVDTNAPYATKLLHGFQLSFSGGSWGYNGRSMFTITQKSINGTKYNNALSVFYRFYTDATTATDYVYDTTLGKLIAVDSTHQQLTISDKKVALSASFPILMNTVELQDDKIYKSSNIVDCDEWYACVDSGDLKGGVLVPNYARLSTDNTGTLTVKTGLYSLIYA